MINIEYTNNNISITQDNNQIIINSNTNNIPNVNIPQNSINTLYVNNPGPKGDKGDQGDPTDTSSFATTGSNNFNGSQSFNELIYVNKSIYGNTLPITIISNTASIDPISASFFTLQTIPSSNIYLDIINSFTPGQTFSLLLDKGISSSINFSSNIKQPSGSSYIPLNDRTKDIFTFISFDTGSIYMVNVLNLI